MKRTARVWLSVWMACILFLAAVPVCALETEETTDIVFVVDCSGSMSLADPEYCARELYKSFINNCDREHTRSGMVCFTDRLEYSTETLRTLSDSESYQQAAAETNHMVYTARDTDIALGMSEAAKMLQGSTAGRKIIVFAGDNVTDLPKGPRTESESAAELASLMEQFAADGIVVCSVGMNSNGKLNTAAMDDMAKKTGGTVYQAKNKTTARTVAKAILAGETEVSAEEDDVFLQIYGSLLQEVMQVETNGKDQTVELSFAFPEEVTNTADGGQISDDLQNAPDIIGEEEKSSIGSKLKLVTEKLTDFRKDTNDAIEGDYSSLGDTVGESGTDMQALPDAAVQPQRNVSDYYLVLKAEGGLKNLKLTMRDNPSLSTTQFIDLENGYYAVSMADFADVNGNYAPLLLTVRGGKGQEFSVMLLNADRVQTVVELEKGAMLLDEKQTVKVWLAVDGEYSEPATSNAFSTLYLTCAGTGEQVVLEPAYEDGCYAASLEWPSPAHLMVSADVELQNAGIPYRRSVSIDCVVTDYLLAAKKENTQFLLLFSNYKGVGGMQKKIPLSSLLDYDPAKPLAVFCDAGGNQVILAVDMEHDRLLVTPQQSFGACSFTAIFYDGYCYAAVPYQTFSVPLLLFAAFCLLIVLIAALIAAAKLKKKYTKFIGKLYLHFKMPEEMSEYAVKDYELIFPYTTKVTLWELIVINESVKLELGQVLEHTAFEQAAKCVTICSRENDNIQVTAFSKEEGLLLNGMPTAKKFSVMIDKNSSFELEFAQGSGKVSVTGYRDANAVTDKSVTYSTEKKEKVVLSDKAEGFRQRMSEISTEVTDEAKGENAGAEQVDMAQNVNYYVFATVLGMLKQNKDEQKVRLYRDTMDFSPVTLIDTGLIENNIYYYVFKNFCEKLDKNRKAALDEQMKLLLESCRSDEEKKGRLEKQTRVMLLDYSTMRRSAAEEEDGNPEENEAVITFYSSVIDVCKQLLSKLGE